MTISPIESRVHDFRGAMYSIGLMPGCGIWKFFSAWKPIEIFRAWGDPFDVRRMIAAALRLHRDNKISRRHDVNIDPVGEWRPQSKAASMTVQRDGSEVFRHCA